MQDKNYSQQVTNRLMEVTKIKSIKDLVIFLDVNEGTFRSWLSRDSLDTRLIIAKCNNEDLNYVLSGKREVNKGANEGANEGAKLDSTEKFPSDGNPACLNCKKLENDIFFLQDVIKANNLSLARYDRENAELRAELEECKGSASKAG